MQMGKALQGHAFFQNGLPLETIEPPRESFNRWIFSGNCRALEGEILDDIPVKLNNWYPTDAAKKNDNVHRWRIVMRKWWTENKVDKDPPEVYDFVFTDDVDNIPFSANEIRLMTRRVVEPVVGPRVRNVVNMLGKQRDAACLGFWPAALAVSDAKCQDNFLESNEKFDKVCVPISKMAMSGSHSVDVDVDMSKKVYTFTAVQNFDGQRNVVASFKLSKWGYDKLSELFIPDSTNLSFWEEAFCCLCRYESLCGGGNDSSEGAGLHAALPQEVFELLPAETIEAFASPFNVGRTRDATSHETRENPTSKTLGRYRRYCAFFEEDRVFGSLGNFFRTFRDVDDVRLLGRNVFFECNPPFDVFVMDRLIDRVEMLLESVQEHCQAIEDECTNSQTLSFLLAFPEWQPNSFRAESPITRLQESRFLRGTRIRRPHQHRYIKGRCWSWSKLPETRGPPLGPGVSKSRITLLSSHPEDCLAYGGAAPLIDSVCKVW